MNYINHLTPELDPLNSSSSDNFDEIIVNNCISNLYIPAKLVTSILQLSQTKFISSLVQGNIFGVLTSSKISLRSLGVKWLSLAGGEKLAVGHTFSGQVYKHNQCFVFFLSF